MSFNLFKNNKLNSENRGFTNRGFTNRGFTMVEMIIVVAIIAILTTVAAIGVQGYLASADKNERDHIAKTAYLGVQDYLLELKKIGQLDDFNKSVDRYASKLDSSKIETILQDHYKDDFNKIYPQYKKNHDGTVIVAVPLSNGDRSNPFYNVLFGCLGQEDVLDKAFVIEYNQTTGVVQAVFYSKSVDSFAPATMYSSSAVREKGNLVKRDPDSLDDKLQGYYGVYDTSAYADVLKIDYGPKDQEEEEKTPSKNTASDNSVSEDKPEEDPDDLMVIHSYRLANKDRIYVHIRDLYVAGATYDVSLYDISEGGSRNLLYQYPQFTLAGSSFKKYDEPLNSKIPTSTMLDDIDSESAVLRMDDLPGMGVYKVSKSMTAKNKQVDVVDIYLLVDCEHHNIVDQDFAPIMHGHGIAELDKSYINVMVKSSTDLETNPATGEPLGVFEVEGDTINPIFEDYDKSTDTFTLSCTRHLNNVREYPSGRHYRVVHDINLKKFEREETDAKAATSISDRHWCTDKGHPQSGEITFESLNCSDTNEFQGTFTGTKKYEVTDKTTLKNILNAVQEEDCYAITGVIIKTDKATKPVGFISQIDENTVFGGIALNEFVISGQDKVGGATGLNQGTVAGVFVNSVSVNGRKMVGGVVGESHKDVINCHFGGNVQSNAPLNTPNNSAGQKKTDYYAADKYRNMGGVVGYAEGVVSGCTVKKGSNVNTNVKAKQLGDINVGGLVGLAMADVTNCKAEGVDVSGYENVGGMIGFGTQNVVDCEMRGPATITGYGEGSIQMDANAISDGINGEHEATIHPVGGMVGYVAKQMSVINCNMYDYDESGVYQRIEVTGVDTKHVGGLVGSNHGEIDSCDVHVSFVKGYMDTGGLVGKMYGPVNNCNLWVSDQVTVKNTGDSCLGGMIGVIGILETDWADGRMIVENCHFVAGTVHGDVAKTHRVGGLVGSIDREVTFRNCSSSANIVIEQEGSRVGGLVGSTSNTRKYGNLVFDNCQFNGTIVLMGGENKGSSHVGGIMAYALNTLDVRNCVNNGIVIAKGTGTVRYIGGMVGECDGYLTVEKCVNNSRVYSESLVENSGGIVGALEQSDEHADNWLKIDSCINNGKFLCGTGRAGTNTTGAQNIGGILGIAKKTVSINKCTNNGVISVAGCNLVKTGGIVGNISMDKNPYSAYITSCSNNGIFGGPVEYIVRFSDVPYHTVTIGREPLNNIAGCKLGIDRMNTGIGGIVGNVEITGTGTIPTLEVSDCTSIGVFKSNLNSEKVGGIVGQLNNKAIDKAILKDLTASTTMQFNGGTNNLGGILGYGNATNVTLDGCKVNLSISNNTGNMNTTGGAIGQTAAKNLVVDNVTTEGEIENAVGTIESTSGIVGNINLIDSVNNISNVDSSISVKALGNNLSKSGGVVGNVATADCIVKITDAINTGDFYAAKGNLATTGGIGGIVGNVGVANSHVSIENALNSGIIKAEVGTGTTIGGILGQSNQITNTISIKDALNNGQISVSSNTLSNTGGIAGLCCGNTTMDNVENKGEIAGYKLTTYVGGIIGQCKGNLIDIKNAHNLAAINFEDGNNSSKLGGVIGGLTAYALNSEETLLIDKSYNTADINVANNKVSQVGGILGYSESKGKAVTITNSYNEGNININNGNADSVGGIIGYFNRNTSNIKLTLKDNIYNKGVITIKQETATNTTNVGGVIGYSNGSAYVNDAKNYAGINVNLGENIGGIIGQLKSFDSEINDVYNEGSVEVALGGKSKLSGGIGYISSGKSGDTLKLTKIVNRGTIKQKSGNVNNVGGVIGYIDATNTEVEVTGCNNDSEIAIEESTAISNVGGLIGQINRNNSNSKIIISGDTYAKGKITINEGTASNIGGLIGFAQEQMELKDAISYTNIEVAKANDNIGGLIGQFKSYNSTIENVHNEGNILINNGNGKSKNSGLIGYVTTGATVDTLDIKKAYNKGEIRVVSGNTSNSGGLVGYSDAKALTITMEDAYNEGNIKVENANSGTTISNFGGLVGQFNRNGSSSTLTIKGSSYNTGSITINKAHVSNMGGIIGNVNGEVTLDGMYNEGDLIVSSGNGTSIGGIAGYSNYNLDIADVENHGSISVAIGNGDKIGGIIGNSNSQLNIDDVENTGNINVATGNGTNIGGILGYGTNNIVVKINNARQEADITIPNGNGTSIGGITGYTKVGLEVTDSSSKGLISTNKSFESVGGLFGKLEYGNAIHTLTAKGNVAYININAGTKATSVGGLIGNIINLPMVDVHDNYSMSDVKYGYAKTSGSLFGYIKYSSGKIYNCYFGGSYEKQSATTKDDNGNSSRNGYLIGKIENATSVVQDCYAIKDSIKLTNYTSFEDVTKDGVADTLRRVGNYGGGDTLVQGNTSYLIYQTHVGNTDNSYVAHALIDENEYNKLCFMFRVSPAYTGNPEEDIKYLMGSYVESDRDPGNFGKTIYSISFNIEAPDGYSIAADVNGKNCENGHLEDVETGHDLSFTITGLNPYDTAEVSYNGTPMTESSGVYTASSVTADGTVNIIVSTQPVVTLAPKFQGSDVTIGDYGTYYSLSSVIDMTNVEDADSKETYDYRITSTGKTSEFVINPTLAYKITVDDSDSAISVEEQADKSIKVRIDMSSVSGLAPRLEIPIEIENRIAMMAMRRRVAAAKVEADDSEINNSVSNDSVSSNGVSDNSVSTNGVSNNSASSNSASSNEATSSTTETVSDSNVTKTESDETDNNDTNNKADADETQTSGPSSDETHQSETEDETNQGDTTPDESSGGAPIIETPIPGSPVTEKTDNDESDGAEGDGA